MRNQCILNIPKPSTVLLEPLHGRPQTLFPIHLLLPTQLMQLSAVDCVPQIIKLSVGNEADQFRFLLLQSKNVNQLLGHLQVTNFILPPNIQNHTRLSLVQNHLKGTRDILNIQKVARVAPIAVQCHRTIAQQLIRKLGNQLLWELMWSIDIISPGNDAGKFERSMVGFY